VTYTEKTDWVSMSTLNMIGRKWQFADSSTYVR